MLCVALAMLAAGCTQTVQRRDALWEARQLLETGRADEAMVRLQGIVLAGEGGAKLAEAQYLLGVAYHRMGAYAKAVEVLQGYVEAYPDGAFAGDAVALLRLISEQAAQDGEKRRAATEAFKARLAEAEAAVRSNPDDAQARAELGDVYYSAGRYEEALAAYARAQALGLDIDASPDRVRRQADAQFQLAKGATERSLAGLVVSDVAHSVRRVSRDGALRNYVIVTGKVTNSRAETYNGVGVNVAVYSTQSELLDVREAGMGTLYPGQSRAFSVRIDDIGDSPIVDVVCTPYAR